jgi:NAD-dependent dihydropyrimidine dehydrogenase PreA subunit
VVPVIDRARCEGKGDCQRRCPYAVFALRAPTADEQAGWSWVARLRLKLHGGQQAFVVHGDACRACGECVAECPEDAIVLRPPEVTPSAANPHAPVTPPTAPDPRPPAQGSAIRPSGEDPA